MITKISVIVPIYNAEKTLKRCIDSIINQSFKDLEIILINDGSCDSSLDICKDYLKINSNIKLIDKNNEGVARARRDGLAITTGEFISFVDSDDFLESNMYEKMLKYNEDIIMCARNVIRKNNNTIKLYYRRKSKKFTVEESICKVLECKEMDSSMCDKLFRRSLFNELEFGNFKINEELFILIDLILNSNGIMHIGEPMYNIDQSIDSTTRTHIFSEKFLDSIKISQLLFSKLNNKKYLKSVSSFYYIILINLYNRLITSSNKDQFIELEKKLETDINKSVNNVMLNTKVKINIKLMYLILKINKTLYIKLFNMVKG